jgi:hypothetical protein
VKKKPLLPLLGNRERNDGQIKRMQVKKEGDKGVERVKEMKEEIIIL